MMACHGVRFELHSVGIGDSSRHDGWACNVSDSAHYMEMADARRPLEEEY